MKTLVIASDDEYEDSKWRLDAIGIDDVERIAPVYTQDRCVHGTTGETGCFRAHRNAWRRCSEQESADRCLVLERDWTYGNKDPDHVKKELSSLPVDGDYYLVGWCHDFHCTHAYVISKDYANKLSSVNECDLNMSVDEYMNGRCNENKSKCAHAYDYPTMSGCYGRGLIQQNRTTMTGMHDADNEMIETRIYDHNSLSLYGL